MIEELIFTSSERGLQIGKSGFCTVASTPEMAANLTRMLESLSGYRHLFTPGSPEAKKNPVVYSFLQVKVGGEQRHVLSRVADFGVDYSGRSNKLAHHVSTPAKSKPVGGPTRMLLDKQFFCNDWQGDPKMLQPRPLLDKISSPKHCKFWEKVTGDAGWAGELIETCQTGKIIYLIIGPTTPSMALLHEALSLLPKQKQWQTTFSSFYRRLPPNVQCQIRCVMADSPEIELTRQGHNNVVWDLTQPMGTPTSHLADFARQGRTITGNESRPVEAEEEATTTRSTVETVKPTQSSAVPSLEGRRPPELPGAAATDDERTDSVKRGFLLPILGILGLLAVAAMVAVLFIPSLKDYVLSSFSPALPKDIVKPLPPNTIVDPVPDLKEEPAKPEEQVFTRLIPPTLLTPPIPKVAIVEPVQQLPVGSRLSATDISFSPRWQFFERSRFPQPVLLIRHTTDIGETLQLDFQSDQDEIEVVAAEGAGQWSLVSSGRELGVMRLVDHKLGSEIEFQCDLDDSGAPTVFLDAIDLLNQSVLEVSAVDLPQLRFDVTTQFIQTHLDLVRQRKPEDVAFGIGGESVAQNILSRDVTMGLREEMLPETDVENAEDENANNARGDAVEEEDGVGEGELIVEFPLPFNQETIQNFTKTQMDAFAQLDVKVNLRLVKELGQPMRYHWESFSFVVADTKLSARSWRFSNHPIDTVSRELKKQLKALNPNQEDIAATIEEVMEFLEVAKTQTSKTLQLTQLMPGRLESPIELKTDKGERYLLFVDIGQQEERWSPEEMRSSYHGEFGEETE